MIFVTVRSRFAGRKFFTPEMILSKLVVIPVSFRDVVRREEMEENPRKRSPDVLDGWEAGVGAVVSMVMRVVVRTLKRLLVDIYQN